MVNCVWFLTGIAGAFLLSLLCQSASMALMGILFSGYLCCVYFPAQLLKRKVQVQIQIPVPVVEAGQLFQMNIQMEWPGKWYTGRVQARVKYRLRGEKIWHFQDVVTGDGSGRNWQRTAQLKAQHPGYLEFQVEELKICDPLGILYCKKYLHREAGVTVLPEIQEIPVFPGNRVLHFTGGMDIYDPGRTGNDPGEIHDMRPFRQGDRMSQVMWKQSAGRENFIVRENSFAKGCPVLFVLYSCKMEKDSLERMASLAYGLFTAGCLYFAVWRSEKNGEVCRVCVENEESFWTFLCTWLQDGSLTDELEVEEWYRQQYPGERFLHVITFREGELLLDRQKLPEKLTEGVWLD